MDYRWLTSKPRKRARIVNQTALESHSCLSAEIMFDKFQWLNLLRIAPYFPAAVLEAAVFKGNQALLIATFSGNFGVSRRFHKAVCRGNW